MLEQAFRNIDDILRKEAGCASELDYTEQASWLQFLKYLDGLEQNRADETALEGKKYTFILDQPYRWDALVSPNNCQSFRHVRIATHFMDYRGMITKFGRMELRGRTSPVAQVERKTRGCLTLPTARRARVLVACKRRGS